MLDSAVFRVFCCWIGNTDDDIIEQLQCIKKRVRRFDTPSFGIAM